MKLNLPSTWTSQKMAILLLNTYLTIKQVKAGRTFKDCLSWKSVTFGAEIYDLLTVFPFNNSEYQTNLTNSNNYLSVCCDFPSCSPTVNEACVAKKEFQCKKFAQNIFCESNLWYCAGIAGDNLITTNYTSNTTNCPSIQAVSNNLTEIIMNRGYDYSHCADESDNNCVTAEYLRCYWDNGGWSCRDCLICDSTCFLQWPAPFPTQLSPNTSTTSSIGNNNFSTTTFIVIGLPTIIGAIAVTSAIILIYYWKKKLQQKEKELLKKREEVIKLSHLNKQKNQTGTSNLVNEEEIINQLVINDEQLNNEIVEQQQSYIEIS